MITRPMEAGSAIGSAMAREPQPHGPGFREVAAGIHRLFARRAGRSGMPRIVWTPRVVWTPSVVRAPRAVRAPRPDAVDD